MAASFRSLLNKGNINKVLDRLNIMEITPGLLRSISSLCTQNAHLYQVVQHITPRLMAMFEQRAGDWPAWQEEDLLIELLSNTNSVALADALMRGASISPKTAEVVISKMMVTEYDGTEQVLAHMLQFKTFANAVERPDVQIGIGSHMYQSSYLKTLHQAKVSIPWGLLLNRTFSHKHKEFLTYLVENVPTDKQVCTTLVRQLCVLSEQGIAKGNKDNFYRHHTDLNGTVACVMIGVERENAGMLAWSGRERTAAAATLVGYQHFVQGLTGPDNIQGALTLLRLPIVDRVSLLDDVRQYVSAPEEMGKTASAWTVGAIIIDAMTEAELGKIGAESLRYWSQQARLSAFVLQREVGSTGQHSKSKKM